MFFNMQKEVFRGDLFNWIDEHRVILHTTPNLAFITNQSGALSPIHSVCNDLHSLTAKDRLLYFAADRLGHFGYERNEADPFVFRKLLIAEIFDFQLKLL